MSEIRLRNWDKHEEKRFLSHFPPRIIMEIKKYNFPSQLDKMVGGAYYHGVVGCGKTLLACRTALEIKRRKYIEGERMSFLFINSTELIEKIKATFSTNTTQMLIDKFKQVDYLILDDIGVMNISDWSYSVFYSILDYRYNNLLTTVFTSNLSIDELSSMMKDDRIPRRITAMCQIINLMR